jgi:hypothetical protein
VIICSVGKCPVDNKSLMCCRYCDKSTTCESACKRTTKACMLQVDKESKVRYRKALEEVLINLRSIDGPNPSDSYIDDSIKVIVKVLKEEKSGQSSRINKV